MTRRIAIAYNEARPPDEGEDLRVYEASVALYDAVDNVHAACVELGWTVERVVVGRDPRPLLDAAARADVVVNFVEDIDGDARLEAAAAWLLEWAGAAFTGSPGLALSLALDKHVAKACLSAAGVPVPAGGLLTDAERDPLPPLAYPVIVKPAREDASLGIERGSVVADEAAARAQAARIVGRFGQPAVVEEFIDGRDLTVALLTRGGGGAPPEMLPIREFDYTGMPAGLPRILTYESKWVPDSDEFRGSPAVPAHGLSADAQRRIEAVARAAWDAIGLRDYARVDMRLPAGDAPVVIDVNPNPDLSSEAGMADTARQTGIEYREMIRRIVEGALDRGSA